MGALILSDNAATTLAASIGASSSITSIVLADATKFPVINHGGTGSDWSFITLFDAAGNIETVKVTRRDSGSNTLTIARGTAAGITGVTDASCQAWASGTTGVACRLVAQTVNDIYAAQVATQAEGVSAANSAAEAANSAAEAAASVAPLAAVNGVVVGNGLGGFTPGIGYDKFASGTRMPFAQSAAPTGWTQDATDNANNRMLRVVNTTGNGVGGSHSPILNNVVPGHTHGITVNATNTDHTHQSLGNEAGGGYGLQPGGYTNEPLISRYQHTSGGMNSNATHSHTGSSDSGSSNTNWTPRYIDLIICAKN